MEHAGEFPSLFMFNEHFHFINSLLKKDAKLSEMVASFVAKHQRWRYEMLGISWTFSLSPIENLPARDALGIPLSPNILYRVCTVFYCGEPL
jgi:hypothetical protein